MAPRSLDNKWSAKMVEGRRLRRLSNQILTLLAMLAPGSGARVFLNRLKGAKIGEGTWIGDHVTIEVHHANPDWRDSVQIGARVAIGPGAKLFTHDTAFAHITRGEHPVKFGRVEIGDDAWIGSNVVIANCNVGKHSVVAPNSLVVHDVPDYTMVRGVPAEIILDLRPVLRRAKLLEIE